MCRIILAAMSTFICLNLWAMSMVPNWVYSKGALFEIRLKIVDQDGAAVSNAKVWGGFTTGERSADYTVIEGFTDFYGEFLVKGRCNELLRVDITKDGYYRSELKINFWESKADPIVDEGRWRPYGETRVVTIKKFCKPHDMIVPSRTPQRKMTICDEWLGFDLEKCDFLPPIGEGVVSDALIRFHREDISRTEWSKSIEVSFANYPYAGVYRKKKDLWSDFKSDYLADTNKVYEASIVFKYVKNGSKVEVSRLGEDEYLVYRTRTKVDKEGKLISARYGKLYGPWYFEDAGGVRISRGFLNREDNDINLENTNPDK